MSLFTNQLTNFCQQESDTLRFLLFEWRFVVNNMLPYLAILFSRQASFCTTVFKKTS